MEKDQIVILKDRGLISVSGADAKDFLQNILSNDINKVNEYNTIFSAIFTPQGKYLYEFFIIKSQNRYLLDCDSELATEILEQAKKDSDHLVIEMNDKFHKSSEIKKNLAENKISQIKDVALKEIKDISIRIAVESVKKIIGTSVDKSKLDSLFSKNLEETKAALKKINS